MNALETPTDLDQEGVNEISEAGGIFAIITCFWMNIAIRFSP
jgi:hypothetical protein